MLLTALTEPTVIGQTYKLPRDGIGGSSGGGCRSKASRTPSGKTEEISHNASI